MDENRSEFYSKAVDYNLFRPEYPETILTVIKSQFGLSFSDLDVVEFGCGTGKFTKILANEARSIIALDKDKEMLRFAEQEFQNRRHIVVVDGEAENSGLESSSLDLVLSAQAFHHFEINRVKVEINRILRANGKIFLLWYFSNMHQDLSVQIRSCFYRYGKKLEQKQRLSISPDLVNGYFDDWNVSFHSLGLFSQRLNRDSFIGSMCSSSYAPAKNSPLFRRYIKELEFRVSEPLSRRNLI